MAGLASPLRLLKSPVDTKRDIEAAPALADDTAQRGYQPRENQGADLGLKLWWRLGRGLEQQPEVRIGMSHCIAGLDAPLPQFT